MITQQELETYLWGAANILRGLVDAADFKQYIFPLVFYKRLCDVWDEEYERLIVEYDEETAVDAFLHRFDIPREYHWNEIRNTSRNVGEKLQLAFVNIENANHELRNTFGTFGDTQWSNKQKFTDEKIKELIEHFSTQTLSIENVPADEMGAAYEYLIKKFADDGGHTAAEFYTNRTVVRLMTALCNPQLGESIYDPTCGSGGMLLEAINHLKRKGAIYQNVQLFGQEKNIITSAIARINMFLHEVSIFDIKQGDTLKEPKFIDNDHLKLFDVILANPPYSIKKWERTDWSTDKWGRNKYGTPPQGCADYAFQQHILASLTPNGRCAVLWPHGVLFRDSEADIRQQIIKDDLVEAIIGLGPNLFYNSSMESCIMLCRRNKPEHTKGKIIFINALAQIQRIRSQSNLLPQHIEYITEAYTNFANIDNFATVATIQQVLDNNANLSIPLYVVPQSTQSTHTIHQLFNNVQQQYQNLQNGMNHLMQQLQQAGL